MKKRCFLLIWVVILLVGFAFFAAAAEKTSDRRYTLPGHGVFQMKVPASWKDEVKQQPDNMPPIISLKPASGDQSIISIIPFWKESEDAPSLNDYSTRRMVQRAADGALPNAVEKTLNIIYLEGSSGHGYYFSATAKAPEPGSCKYMTQGILLVDDLAVSFVILTNDGQKDAESAALTMLQSAIYAQGKGD